MNNGELPPARTPMERDLERVQREWTRALKVDEQRRHIIARLYEGGMSQVEIAARLSRASRQAGGEDVGVDGIQKMLKKMRVSRRPA